MDDGQGILVLPEPLGDIVGLEERAAEFEAEAARLIAKADAIRQIVAGVHALNGEAGRALLRRSFESHKLAFDTRPLDASGPRGPKAVLVVMSEQSDRTWKVLISSARCSVEAGRPRRRRSRQASSDCAQMGRSSPSA